MQLSTNNNSIPINSKSTLRAFINKGLKPTVQVADLTKVKLKRVGDSLLIEDSVDKSKLEIPNLWQECQSEADCTVTITSSAQPGQSITITPNSVANLQTVNGNATGNLLDGSNFSWANSIMPVAPAAPVTPNITTPTPSTPQPITKVTPTSNVLPTTAAKAYQAPTVASEVASGVSKWLYALGGVVGGGAVAAAAGGGSDATANTAPAPVGNATVAGENVGDTFEGDTAKVTGQLTVTDPDPNQNRFQPISNQAQTYGTFSITASGAWTYQVNNNLPAVSNLTADDTVNDTILVRTTDGTIKAVIVFIDGVSPNATITGTALASVLEGSNTAVTGQLNVADPDSGESLFIAQANQAKTYGTFSIAANGNWSYQVNNSNTTVTNLETGQTLTDTITVQSVDGTTKTIAVTINGLSLPNAIITGTATAATSEGSTTPVTGQLNVTDPNPLQSQFQVQTNLSKTYGTFSISANGSWTYQVNNTNPSVANLNAGQTLTDTIIVQSIDGTNRTVTVTINGTTTQTTAFVENQSTAIPVYAASASNVTSWVISGADANLFNVDSTGRIFINAGVVLDFDQPIDAGQNNTYNLTLTGTGTGQPITIPLALTLADLTETPTWLSNNNIYVSRASGSGSLNEQSGIASLLSNNSDQASWHATVNGVRPVGAGISLTYAFQNFGSEFDAKVIGFINGSFNNQAKEAIRTIFSHIASFTNISFSETTSQSILSGYADIRLFSGSDTNIDADGALAYAYQPSSNNPKTTEFMGNVFLNETWLESQENTNSFGSLFSLEQQTMTHEIGHALGLDHPFNESGATAGFSNFFEPASFWRSVNNFGIVTGGGHDTPLTDSPLETIMTYHDIFASDSFTAIKETPILPWKAGVYDMAALQHLYGANLAHNSGDTVYNYYSDQPVYDTIWDGGGTDTIVQNGNREAVIDLRGGSEFSRVGYFSPLKIEFDVRDINPSHNNNSAVVFSDPSTIFTNTNGKVVAYLPMPIDSTTISVTVNTGTLTNTNTYSFLDILEEEKYNLGIGFGVTIENATGGGGNDILIGNDAPNVLNGGAGDDSLVSSFGADTFISGSGFDVLLVIKAADVAFDTWTDFDIAFDQIFIPKSTGLTEANLQWTQASNTLRITEGSNTYDMVIQTNGLFNLSRDVLFI